MKSLSKYLVIILVFSLLFTALTGCVKEKSSLSDSEGSQSSAEASESEGAKSQTLETKTGKSYDSVSAEIKLSGSSAEISGSGAQANEGNIVINKGGAYSISGKLTDGKITVDAGDEDVTLILDGAEITSSDSSAINVYKAGIVTIELADKSENTLSDASKYVFEDSYSDKTNEEPSACIFSKSDLIITGAGQLKVSGNFKNGIKSKDLLTLESANIIIDSADNAVTGNDGVIINGAGIEINSKGDGIHSNSDIEINSGKLTIKSDDDGIHADNSVTVNGGELDITAHEGVEGTVIKINDGTITISASDDGINAAQKVDGATPTVEINGGSITITMGAGDTDAIDSNGNIIINGGKITITGQSGFDYENKAELNGGEVYLNGNKITEITNQFAGGMRGFGGKGFGSDPSGENGEAFAGGTPPMDENGGFFRGGTPPTDENGEFIRGGNRRGFSQEAANPELTSGSETQSAQA